MAQSLLYPSLGKDIAEVVGAFVHEEKPNHEEADDDKSSEREFWEAYNAYDPVELFMALDLAGYDLHYVFRTAPPIEELLESLTLE